MEAGLGHRLYPGNAYRMITCRPLSTIEIPAAPTRTVLFGSTAPSKESDHLAMFPSPVALTNATGMSTRPEVAGMFSMLSVPDAANANPSIVPPPDTESVMSFSTGAPAASSAEMSARSVAPEATLTGVFGMTVHVRPESPCNGQPVCGFAVVLKLEHQYFFNAVLSVQREMRVMFVSDFGEPKFAVVACTVPAEQADLTGTLQPVYVSRYKGRIVKDATTYAAEGLVTYKATWIKTGLAVIIR